MWQITENSRNCCWLFEVGQKWQRYFLCHFEKVRVYWKQLLFQVQCGMLQRTQTIQRTVFINKIRILQRTQMLQRTRKNTIRRRNTQVCMTCRVLSLWLERQSSSLLSFVRFSYQFSSDFVILLLWKARLHFSLGEDRLCSSCALDCLCFLLGKVYS
jgi:hypothetical protein